MIDLDLAEHLDLLTPEELALEMLGLLEAVDFEYERFAEALELEINDETDELYQLVHRSYAETWNRMGTDPFVAMLAPSLERWRVITA